MSVGGAGEPRIEVGQGHPSSVPPQLGKPRCDPYKRMCTMNINHTV